MITPEMADLFRREPLKVKEWLWPDVNFYNRQCQLVMSVWENRVTFAPGSHKSGKSFVSAFTMLTWFLVHPGARVLFTSVDEGQVKDILWGEIDWFLRNSVVPLDVKKGGPFHITDMHIRKVDSSGKVLEDQEMRGRVAAKGEAMAARHSKTGKSLVVFDESSGIDDGNFTRAETWANKLLVMGNPYECNNYFYRGVQAGNKKNKQVVKFSALDSPNVRLAQAEIQQGEEPSYRQLVPGVINYEQYEEWVDEWDEQLKTIALYGEFYEGAEIKMFPQAWLEKCVEKHKELVRLRVRRVGKAIGIDTAQGGDFTVWIVIDDYGVIEMVTKKTPEPTDIMNITVGLMRKHNIRGDKVCFDRGGGGHEHAGYIRKLGPEFNVTTVGFGESATPDIKRGMKIFEEKKHDIEIRYVYKNKRAQLFGETRRAMNPDNWTEHQCFAIPPEILDHREKNRGTLREQLKPIPVKYDGEGRFYLLPKTDPDPKKDTLTKLIGHSPDEADALCLANWILRNKVHQPTAGTF